MAEFRIIGYLFIERSDDEDDVPLVTKSGKTTKLGDVEPKLKKEYPNNPGALYGTLNKIGLMRGNKATKKGASAAKSKK